MKRTKRARRGTKSMRDRSDSYTTEDWREIKNGLKERCDHLVKEKYELIAEIIEDLKAIRKTPYWGQLSKAIDKWEGKAR